MIFEAAFQPDSGYHRMTFYTRLPVCLVFVHVDIESLFFVVPWLCSSIFSDNFVRGCSVLIFF